MNYGGAPASTHPLAIAALVLGILSLFTCCCWGLGILPSLAAVICGGIGLSKINQAPHMHDGKGLAIAGIVCGSVGIVLAILGLVMNVAGQLSQQVH
jgi:hypothetical protein